MKKLLARESGLVGHRIEVGSDVQADATCRRIEWLTNEVLQEMAADPSGWDVLYKHNDDGRFWELTYAHSEMHGGGPPRRRCLSIAPQSAGELADWAATRGADTVHPLTQELKGAIVDVVRSQ